MISLIPLWEDGHYSLSLVEQIRLDILDNPGPRNDDIGNLQERVEQRGVARQQVGKVMPNINFFADRSFGQKRDLT